ncbi:MAG: InlB B-repeat-containing protein [Spirochaetaceae bacterium]|jgi:hypothetical protein|nr:InlB B-repeat-containing protein [Spirochaetaceae bacterium]
MGAFEKRIATPEKVWYELNAAAETDEDQPDNVPSDEDGEEIMSIQFTTDAGSPDRKQDGLIFGENYRLRDSIGSDLTQAAAPEFTRAHYNSDGWKDMTGNSVTPTYKNGENTNENSYNVTGDTQLYQQWTANTFTVTFNLNGKTPSAPASLPADIIGVNEALSATGGLRAASKNLPTITEKVEENGSEDTIIYEFVNWADNKEGGNIISASTPLFPKDNTATVTLYAQWRVEGGTQYNFRYIGANSANGTVQTWKVPVDGVYKIEVWGAGGNGGGLGGYIGGDIALTKGRELYIYVGGQGYQAQVNVNDKQQAGGWNGGGASGGAPSGKGVNTGGGGHGATDVRTVSGNWNDNASLESRIIVAGGGGGGGSGSGDGYHVGNGGLGIAEGGDGSRTDNGVTVTAGGGKLDASGGVSNPGNGIDRVGNGVFGIGGHGGRHTRGGGGGGGGYYGGGGGTDITGNNADGVAYQHPSGGGGGSSWAETKNNAPFKFTNIVPGAIVGNGAVNGGGTIEGNGKVLITLVSTTSD